MDAAIACSIICILRRVLISCEEVRGSATDMALLTAAGVGVGRGTSAMA